MTDERSPSAEEIIALLGLEPHPGEGGLYAETWRSDESLAADALPGRYAGPRALGTAIYYLLTPDTLLVPRGSWQGSRLIPGGRVALLGTTVAPGYDPQDFERGDREKLIDEFPGHAPLIRVLTRENPRESCLRVGYQSDITLTSPHEGGGRHDP